MIAKIKIGRHHPGEDCRYLFDSAPMEDLPLRVVSAGYGPEKITPRRVFIRNYYVLHFVIDGHGHYNGMRFSPGDALLSTPLVPEVREFPPDVHLTCAWIRFEGESVPKLLSKSGISNNTQVIPFSKCKEAVAIIKDTIHTPHEESTLGYTLLGAFFRLLALFPLADADAPSKSSIVDDTVFYIKRHYNCNLTLNDLAARVNVSPGHLSRLFKQQLSFSVMDFINQYRFDCASLLLRDTSLKIYEIASAVGFRDPHYFSHFFTVKMGVSPAEYRKKQS